MIPDSAALPPTAAQPPVPPVVFIAPYPKLAQVATEALIDFPRPVHICIGDLAQGVSAYDLKRDASPMFELLKDPASA